MPLVKIPPDLLCPITQELFVDPVITCDGHSYERSAIQKWFDSRHNTSPLTGQRLPALTLTPNLQLKSQVTALRDSLIPIPKFLEAVSNGDLKTLQTCNYLPSHLEARIGGSQLLREAVRRDKPEVVRWLLAAGVDVDATLLLDVKSVDVAKLLVENKVSFTARTTEGNSVLVEQLERQDVLQYLLEVMDSATRNALLESKREDGETILHAVCLVDNPDSVAAVLQYLPATINLMSADLSGNTALHYGLQMTVGCCFPVLLDHYGKAAMAAAFKCRNAMGDTPLHSLMIEGNFDAEDLDDIDSVGMPAATLFYIYSFPHSMYALVCV
jgi:hypothetical protein